ncbi:hypothetical protein VL10_09365 [Leclercia adecarboxylata]|nr:hypothetical protein VL10_09365 [Leclercia adecarboxylata]KMN61785.1 hypothetical protein VK95_23035 [Leclercia sp. LK8]
MMLASLLPLSARAETGSWSQETYGGRTSVGGQIVAGRPLVAPPLPRPARVVSLSWQIALSTPAPPELEIKLCNAEKCLYIPTLRGHLRVRTAFSVTGPWRFIYMVNREGKLSPALNVLSNQLTINYRLQ